MKTDKLRVEDIVWYKDYRVHFCIVKKIKGNNVIISEEIYNHPLFKRRVKKNDVQKIPIVFYSPNKKRKLFCISPSEDIFIEQKFIAIYL